MEFERIRAAARGIVRLELAGWQPREIAGTISATNGEAPALTLTARDHGDTPDHPFERAIAAIERNYIEAVHILRTRAAFAARATR